MSEENVETVRRVYDAFGEGDFVRALEEGEPDFEWIPPGQDVQGPVQGLESLRRFLEDQNEAFEDLRVEAEELKDHGDQVLALIRVRGRVSRKRRRDRYPSGDPLDLSPGPCNRGQVFPEREKALEAAGLSE